MVPLAILLDILNFWIVEQDSTLMEMEREIQRLMEKPLIFFEIT